MVKKQKNIIFDGEDMITPTDYEKKYEVIVEELDKDIFAELKADKETKVDVDIEKLIRDAIDDEKSFEATIKEIKKKKEVKRKFLKNEIVPLLTPMQVSSRLNELLRVYKPLNLEEAKTLEDRDYLEALKWYMKLITYINEYLVFLPSKQTFCAFANITTSIYNELLTTPSYSQVFNSVEDYIVDANFLSSQAGIVESKTTLSKLQTKDAGHNLVRNPEALTINTFAQIDTHQVNERLEKWKSMANIGYKGDNK